MLEKRPRDSARARAGRWISSDGEAQSFDLQRTKRPFGAGENSGQAETDFETLSSAIELKLSVRFIAQAQIADDYRMEKWRFNFSELQAQSFSTRGALRPPF